MGIKCSKCGVPLEGILYKFIAAPLFGIKLSEKEPGVCNKCETPIPRARGEGEGTSDD